jgi:hypothetical protein
MTIRETTLTDYVVLRLLEECCNFVDVFTFPAQLEANTGADMELWLTDSSGSYLGLRIQCKALGPNDLFEDLDYRTNNRGQHQWDVLITSTKSQGVKGCLPLYLLYVGPNNTGFPHNHVISTFLCGSLAG